jgi:hypothetical protein
MRSRHRESAPQVICFDVGYTLIDETRSWLAWAARLEGAVTKFAELFCLATALVLVGRPTAPATGAGQPIRGEAHAHATHQTKSPRPN